VKEIASYESQKRSQNQNKWAAAFIRFTFSGPPSLSTGPTMLCPAARGGIYLPLRAFGAYALSTVEAKAAGGMAARKNLPPYLTAIVTRLLGEPSI
jgi:hypothetical protein